MIPEIISIAKSMSCRLQEFENLLSDVETPCSEIDEVWSSIFQDLVIPNCGWEALWLMSEKSCMKYDVIHPTAVIVTASAGVENYEWDIMAATVTVTGVQGDITLPSMLDVPVIELHPIKDQEYDEDDLKVIADWLDKCRYFFKYLWYPWDEKEKVRVSDWCSSHLEKRLQFQCDVQNGVLSKKIANYHKSLLTESNQVYEALSALSGDDLSENQSVRNLKNCLRRKILKLELDLMEFPETRNDLMRLRFGEDWDKENLKNEAKFIWKGGSVDTLLLNLSTVKSHIDNDVSVKVSSSLQDALDSSSGDKIFLPSGSHVLTNLNGLDSGGVIRGLGNSDETIILADFTCARRAVFLSCLGDFEFQNLTIAGQEGIAVQIFEKTLKISNCRLTSKKSATARGVIVLPGCTLMMENCQIFGFGVGIVLKKGSKAFISNTRISECFIGMKVGEGADVAMKDVEISNSAESAVCLESSESRPDLPKIGDFELLSDFCEDQKFSFESVELKNNKRNVVIADNLDGFAPYSFGADRTHETITLSDEDSSEFISD